MPDDPHPTCACTTPASVSENPDADPLTPAQRQLTRLLGQLLAERWNRRADDPTPRNLPESDA